MNDLLKEAIADAKAVREVALANAKLALEEAFTPRLQSMLSQKLSEEAEMDDDSKEVEEEGYFNEFAMGEGEDETEEGGEDHEEKHDEPKEEGADYNDMDEYFGEAEDSEEGSHEKDLEERISELERNLAKFEAKGSDDEENAMEEGGHGDEDEEEIDEDLMEVIRQLEEDLGSSEIGKGDNKKPSAKASDDSTQDPAGSQKVVQLVEEEDEKVDEAKEEDEDVNEILRAIREEDDKEEKVDESSELDINEILRALREEEDDEEKMEEAKDDSKEMDEANSKLREAYAVITFLRSKINEVNLLNSKLLYSNKLFKKHSLTENQKITVIENFDRASSLREVKLVYATLSEALKSAKTNIKPLKESFASKPIASTRPTKTIINEGDDMANRLRKLAGLK
jgi:hypothetical protein